MRIRVEELTVEPSHENDTIDAHLPLLTEHNLSLLPEVRSMATSLASLARLNEKLRFREAHADQADSDRKSSSDPEDSLPCLDVATHTEVCTSRADIAEGVALLENTRHETSSVHGTVFQCHSNGITVDTAHEKAEQRPNSKELLKRPAVDRSNL